MDELEPLNIKRTDIINLLAKNGYLEKYFKKSLTVNHSKRKDEIIWLTQDSQLRMAIAHPDKVNPPPIRMIGFYFENPDSWKQNYSLIEQVLGQIIPNNKMVNLTLKELQMEMTRSASEDAETVINGYTIALSNYGKKTFTAVIIKRVGN